MVLLKNLLALRFRISTKMYAAIGTAVVLTVIASLIGSFSFGRIGTSLAEVNDVSIPRVEVALAVAEYSADLRAAATRLTTVSTPAELDEAWQQTVAIREDLQTHIEGIERFDSRSSYDVRISSDALSTYVESIRNNRKAAFALDEKSQTLQNDLAALSSEFDSVLSPAVVDEFNLATLRSNTNIGLQHLSQVLGISDPLLVDVWERSFRSSLTAIEYNMASLNDEQLEAKLTPLYEKMQALGLSGDGIFSVWRSRLQLNEQQAALLELSGQQTRSLASISDELALSAVESIEQASETSYQAMGTGRTLLLVVSAIAVIAGLLISWRFVGRALLRRIDLLTDKMRLMAAGQLNEEVEVIGHDELAEMAAALEVFRLNSLEALRLDLVETLNIELEGKNTELERVLEELRTAQNQIVMREKLAALGEVTAGVAHEIRNPLNFVTNFSELSQELLQEILSEIEDAGDDLDVTLIAEISNDLVENLERIMHHGDRANRIVTDMLLMSQSSNDWQSIDLNNLLVEHAMLAYHSARAMDTEFNLIVEKNLDEDLGEVRAIPQNLGRAFLNIVGNACQATDEKRRKLAAAGIGFEGYAPTVRLSTKGLKEEIEIRIRDNGVGIPQDIIENIFNPFFTTKPTNQGTGLGLAITSDIVREHGGYIKVESEPDQYTEMLITVPRSLPDEVAQSHAGEAFQSQR